MIQRVRGTEDYLDLGLFAFTLNTIKKHLATYNFNQIETPIIESTDLFIRSVGKETDIVSKEMYIFQTASGESLCLRPEATASIIRAYVENKVQTAPWKVFLHGPMFRHERPQKGRYRQFSQVSVEVINAKSIVHDAQMLKMFDVLFSEIFKFEHYITKLNFLGCSADRKAHREKLVEFLHASTESICDTCIVRRDKNPLRVFDCKNESCKKHYAKAPLLTDFLCSECKNEWQQLQELLSILSVNVVLDPWLVRGLDYYNKTVFEFVSNDALGAQNAFGGGGRYNLGKDVGADDDLHCVGAGLGFERLAMLVESNKSKLLIPETPALHVLVPFTEEQVPLCLLLADQLQAHGLCVDVILDIAAIGKMMKRVHTMGATWALVIGPDEQAQQMVSAKHMSSGKTESIKQADLLSFLRR